jgi:D-alanyl-D-alanine carboxypeptidase
MPLTISKPTNNASFPLGEAVEFDGAADAGIVRVELKADDAFIFPTVTLSAGRWFVANRLNQGGPRRITARGFDAADNVIASEEVNITIRVPDFGSLVPIPAGINKNVTKARQKTMLDTFGQPGGLSTDCTAPTSDRVRKLLVTSNVGPFSVTGLKPAVEALQRIFSSVRQEEPELFGQLGTAGMLCCRRIRTLPGKPPSKQFSNHSWGTAVDIKIKGALDPRGDGKTQLGLLLLHPFFNEEKFFWGAGFGGGFEDSMHFEASDELVREWKEKGIV